MKHTILEVSLKFISSGNIFASSVGILDGLSVFFKKDLVLIAGRLEAVQPFLNISSICLIMLENLSIYNVQNRLKKF
jgi:hypothetical protein